MTDGPSSLSNTPRSSLPDKQLIVKCQYNAHRQKLTFQSAQNCTYDKLQEKIKKRFDLTGPFIIQWEDDYGEQNCIQDESSLNEAIDFYHTEDSEPVGSSGSVFSSRSSRHPKITMLIEISGEYDGPSLSDTASLASREEDPLEEFQLPFSPGQFSSSPQDDDAVTVSSRDTHTIHSARQSRADSSLIRKLLHPSRAGSSCTPNRQPLKSSRSRIFNLGSRASSAEEETPGSSSDRRINGSNSGSIINTEGAYPGDTSVLMFEHLKLEDQGNPPSSHLQTESGTAAWLQDQIALRMKATIHAVPPSTVGDSFSLNTDSPLSGDISLRTDERGKNYYVYTLSGSSESAGEFEYEVVNGIQPRTDNGIPHEFLVPTEVTDCSACGDILDQIKYICTTCGEKTPMSRAALAAAAAAAGMGKGESRASPCHPGHSKDYEPEGPAYPPHAHRSPATSYPYSNNSNTLVYSSSSKPLPALPSTSPTQTIFGRNLGSQSTLVSSNSSGSSSPTIRVGYELCTNCFERVGLDHSLPGGAESPSLPTPQERAIARRSAPKRRGELRHAFRFQIWGFNGWQDIEQDEPSDDCSACRSPLSRDRYKCGKCDSYTICIACYSDVHNIHPIHPFLEVRTKPPSQSHPPSEGLNGTETYDSTDEQSLKHPDVRCINCQQDIVGARFHCVDCTTIDIDICSNCETAGLPGNLDASGGGHISSHIMLKIPVPLNMHEMHYVSQRAHGLRHGRDRADLRGVSPLLRSSPSSISSLSASTVLYPNDGAAEIEEGEIHPQACNACAKHIVGPRYQCLNCPSIPHSFNLCSDCETKSYKVHDPQHVFLKVPRPVEIPGPLESEFPIIPLLYKDPAGPVPGSSAAEISGDPAAYLRELTHAFALCDRHMMRILGKWYRCAFCAKDLCADCEALDTHDNTHVFLVFKAPVDMQAFRHFADLESPTGSPPVLRGDIYYPQHN